MQNYKHFKKTSILVLIILSLFSFVLSADAATITWNGGGSDNLASNPANWSGGIVPQYGDDVIFDNASKDCTWDITVTLASLTIASGYAGTVTLSSSDDLTIAANFVPPSAVTEPATNINGNAATLNATVNPNGLETTVYFEWGTTTSYGNTTPVQSIGNGTSFITVGSNLTGLLSGMTYHYRVVATNVNGTTYGDDNYFITRGTAKPDAITDTATNITDNSVTLNARVNPRALPTTAYFEWGTTTSYGNTTSVQSVGYGAENVSVSSDVMNLSAGTTYHYRIVATNENGTNYGDDMSFTTSGESPPSATTNPVSNINGNSATLNATVNPNGSATTGYFQWDTNTSYNNSTTPQSIGSGTSDIPVSANITGLLPNTTYYYRIVAINNGGTSYGDDKSFTTPPITLTIIYPLDSETINRPDVMVEGTVSNATGNETGVTVNGIVATVYGNQFIVNHVPLEEGQNTITANATDTAGNIATTSITVNAITSTPYIELHANIESGIAPLTTYFSVSTSIPNAVSTYQMDYEGDGTIDYTGTTFDNISFAYTTEGIYYPTVIVTDNQGIQYSDTIAIVVLNASQLDALLRAKWEGMRSNLSNRDTATALTYISSGTRTSYEEMFNALIDQLPSIVATQTGFNLVSITDDIAEYELVTIENGAIYSYEVIFIKDEKGIWMIQDF